MNTSSFYKDLDFKYPEIAICLEDTNNGIGKFFIPVLTPFLNKDIAYDKKEVGISTMNILNKNLNIEIDGCNLSNYIELKMPVENAKKGDTFIVVFVGGDINKARIIGGY